MIMTILIFGNGYLGKRCAEAWEQKSHRVILSPVRVRTMEDALEEIRLHKPNAVFNAAGVKGKPNVDWCEDHAAETIRGNTLLPLLIAEACQQEGVYFLHIGSGCVYYGDSPHTDKHWREGDHANPSAVYSRSKYAADLALSTFKNVGIARIRMPIDHVPDPGNLLNKLARYEEVIDVENSVTVVEDMIAVFLALMEKKGEGIFHVTNPGTIRHREILDGYREIVDPAHTCQWITNDALVERGLAKKGRSNNFLTSTRLEEMGIAMRPVKIAVRETLERYAQAKKEKDACGGCHGCEDCGGCCGGCGMV
jgi:3,5-epimerase/4-reductase